MKTKKEFRMWRTPRNSFEGKSMDPNKVVYCDGIAFNFDPIPDKLVWDPCKSNFYKGFDIPTKGKVNLSDEPPSEWFTFTKAQLNLLKDNGIL